MKTYNNQKYKILCTICARAGSKGIKDKNIRDFCGKPLLAHTIQQAIDSSIFFAIAVSSDSEKFLNIAKEWGAQYLIHRPDYLASDSAAKIPCIQHCVQETEKLSQQSFDIVVDLAVTSPLRSLEDIQQAIELLIKQPKAKNIVSAQVSKSSPYYSMVEQKDNVFVSLSKQPDVELTRRQDTPVCYDLNGAVYAWQREALFTEETLINDRTLIYKMPAMRSIDVDSLFELELTKLIYDREFEIGHCYE